jgi:hypothetical protein
MSGTADALTWGMCRLWKWPQVACLVVMLVLSAPAQASDAAVSVPADEFAPTVTYTPIIVDRTQRPTPAPPVNAAPATRGGATPEWKAMAPLPSARLAPPTGAEAAQQYRDHEDRPIHRGKHRLMGNFGFCSVVGEIGATYTYAPVPLLQVELGSGLGFSGIQFSLMPKVSLGTDRHRLVMGIGPSVGINPDDNPPHTYVAYWLNAEVGYEFRADVGFTFLIAGGYFRSLAGEYRNSCVFDCDGDTKGRPSPATDWTLPQGRIAFGHWF